MISKNYKKAQEIRQENLFKGYELNQKHPYILTNNTSVNLIEDIRTETESYFKANGISWWNGVKVTGNLLSSQVACLNHLMPIKNNHDAVLSILKNVDNDFTDVLPIESDNKKHRGYIAFEVVSDNGYLNERNNKRGANCTSIDAVVLGVKKDVNVLVAIEWKYTEFYFNVDKSSGKSGITRKKNYSTLIKNSNYLKNDADSKVFFHEPFYQLMRQTLWAEQMILHCNQERLKAKDYLHLHIIPKDNYQLIGKTTYKVMPGKTMEEIWKSMLKKEGAERYLTIDPSELLRPINVKDFPYIKYIKERYW